MSSREYQFSSPNWIGRNSQPSRNRDVVQVASSTSDSCTKPRLRIQERTSELIEGGAPVLELLIVIDCPHWLLQ